MVRSRGVEPPTKSLGNSYSIQLSYERILYQKLYLFDNCQDNKKYE